MAYMTKSEFNLQPSVAAGLTATGDVIITERGVPTYKLSRIPQSGDPWQRLIQSGLVTPAASTRHLVAEAQSFTGLPLGALIDEDRADRW